jgi:hypothetical protein
LNVVHQGGPQICLTNGTGGDLDSFDLEPAGGTAYYLRLSGTFGARNGLCVRCPLMGLGPLVNRALASAPWHGPEVRRSARQAGRVVSANGTRFLW